MKLSDTLPIWRYREGQFSAVTDPVVVEYSLMLWLNGQSCGRLACSPQDLDHLVRGYLYCEGLIGSLTELKSLEVDPEAGIARAELTNWEPTVFAPGASHDDSSRPIAPLPDGVSFSVAKLLPNLQQFYANADLHRLTGGVHCCALCDDTGILRTAVDISRHNAFDKVVGMALQEGLPLPEHYLLTSGRVPSEIASKAINARLPMLVSRAAPSNLGIKMAREANLTLLGFAREDRFNLYHGESRLRLNDPSDQ